MNKIELCDFCLRIMRSGDDAIRERHFHFGKHGQRIMCLVCLANILRYDMRTCYNIWKIGRLSVPTKFLTDYNSRFNKDTLADLRSHPISIFKYPKSKVRSRLKIFVTL